MVGECGKEGAQISIALCGFEDVDHPGPPSQLNGLANLFSLRQMANHKANARNHKANGEPQGKWGAKANGARTTQGNA